MSSKRKPSPVLTAIMSNGNVSVNCVEEVVQLIDIFKDY